MAQINLFTKLKKRNSHMAKIAKVARLTKLSNDLSSCFSFVSCLSDKQRTHYLAVNSNRCKQRVCPICQYIKSRQMTNVIETMLNYELSKHYKNNTRKYDLIFLTLTIPNVKPTIHSVKRGKNVLRHAMHNFIYDPRIRGWNTKRQSFHGVLKGIIRKVEYVSKNRYQGGTINLHSHILGLVRGSYYHSHLYYHGKKWWSRVWQQACGHQWFIYERRAYYNSPRNNKRYVLPRKVNQKKDQLIIKHISKEIGKYAGKSEWKPHYSYKDVKLEAKQLKAVYRGLKGMVDIRYYGAFRVAHRLLNKGALVKYSHISKTIYSILLLLVYYTKHSKYKEYQTKLTLNKSIKIFKKFLRQGRVIRIYPLLKAYNNDLSAIISEAKQGIRDEDAEKIKVNWQIWRSHFKHAEKIGNKLFIGYQVSYNLYNYRQTLLNTKYNKEKIAKMINWHSYCASELHLPNLIADENN